MAKWLTKNIVCSIRNNKMPGSSHCWTVAVLFTCKATSGLQRALCAVFIKTKCLVLLTAGLLQFCSHVKQQVAYKSILCSTHIKQNAWNA